MRHYENLIILKPSLTEEETKAMIEQIETSITENGGEIIAVDARGVKKLAYAIDKNPRGHFHIMYFKMNPSSIEEIERRYRINEEVLRFVTMVYASKREIAAWTGMVEKTQALAAKKAAPAPEAAPAPVKEETPAPEAPTATEA